MLQFKSADLASKFARKAIIYDRCSLTLVQEMRSGNSFPTNFVRISNLPKFFHEVMKHCFTLVQRISHFISLYFGGNYTFLLCLLQPHFKHFFKEREGAEGDVVVNITDYDASERTCIAEVNSTVRSGGCIIYC